MDLNNSDHRQKLILQYLSEQGPLSLPELSTQIEGASYSTLNRDIDQLEAEGKVMAIGSGSNTQYQIIETPETTPTEPNDLVGKVIEVSKTTLDDAEPLVQVKVMNPLAYLKKILKELFKNEGLKVRFSFEIKPLTVIGITLVIFTAGLGVKTLTLFFKYTPLYPYFRQLVTEPDHSRVTGFQGKILVDQEDILLMRYEAEAILLQSEIELSEYDQTNVYVKGRFNPDTNKLQVHLIYPTKGITPLPSDDKITKEQVQLWVNQITTSLDKTYDSTPSSQTPTK